jgi:ATPase subunit of ABC transporter with duplicated ATPase domains
MRSISSSGLTFRLPDGRPLFQQLSFDFGVERTGLVGANGIGKSVLLRVLMGELAPGSGTVTVDGSVARLPQDLAPFRSGTVAAALGLRAEWEAWRRVLAGAGDERDLDLLADHWDLEERMLRLLAGAGLPWLRPGDSCSALSGGELLRLVLAGMAAREPDFLLLDEPTNHLDGPSRAALYALVDEWKSGLVVVSHDRELLRRMDRMAELSALGLRFYGGGFDAYRARKEDEVAAARDAAHAAAVQLRKDGEVRRRALERQQKRAARGAKRAPGSGTPRILLGMMKRGAERSTARLARVHAERVDESEQKLAAVRARVPVEERIRVELDATAVPSRKLLVEAQGVNFRLADGALLWREPVDLALRGPVRLAIRGTNGAGKSVLAGMILGSITPATGTIALHVERVAYLDQRVALLDDGRSVLENLRAFAPAGTPEHDLRTRLRHLGFTRNVVDAPASGLSGGERMRAGLACLLTAEAEPRLLVLDEPTNNLDFASLEAVEGAVRAFRGALVVISHDEDFLANIGIEESLTVVRGRG